jgi:hypothetical protein
MTSRTTAWVIACVAGGSSGVIAGLQICVTASAIVAITAVLAAATGLIARVQPRGADHAL